MRITSISLHPASVGGLLQEIAVRESLPILRIQPLLTDPVIKSPYGFENEIAVRWQLYTAGVSCQYGFYYSLTPLQCLEAV